ncbi:DUF3152 domain-containing protein [Streptomyces sp. NPDC048277]|uniref:DUF3152 domain-containing protein n=1 Tax=Streptomyces sp. NPDC048277 TaxID=3155027 RepID=UPI00340E37EA
MTTRTARSSRGRRRNGPSHAVARGRTRRGPLWVGLAALAFLGAAGFVAVGGGSSGADTGHAGAAPSGPTERARSSRLGSTTPSPGPRSPSAGSRSPSPGPATTSASPSPRTSRTPEIPATGPGTFVTAAGSSARVGSGTVLRYRVDVETGIDLSATDVARQVERILADPRGWTADGHSAFERVSSGPTDFVVQVATPGTVDKICGEYGLDTGGEVNCNVAQHVMVNLRRWLLATPVYAHRVKDYRALIINHEVGHFLGHGHVGCPGAGQPAPVMMQQIKGMHGCLPNVWPYDDKGRYVTGPALS